MSWMDECLIIDASFAVRGVLPLRHSETIAERLEAWFETGMKITVPGLWLLEVTSTVHRLMMLRQISGEEADAVLDALLGLPLEVVPEDTDLCHKAFVWANRLGHLAIYDSVYLALAERLNAGLYTADKKLFHRCQQIGVSFVKMLE